MVESGAFPEFLVSVQMGAESFVVDELRQRHSAHVANRARPLSVDFTPEAPVAGYVLLRICSTVSNDEIDEYVTSVLLKMRSVHHVYRYHFSFPLPTIPQLSVLWAPWDRSPGDQTVRGATGEGGMVAEAVYQHIRAMNDPVPSLSAPGVTFRVTSDRVGSHKFSSKELEFESGGALAEIYGARPKMRGYDIHVRVDVVGRLVVVGTQLNEDALSRRHKSGESFLSPSASPSP